MHQDRLPPLGKTKRDHAKKSAKESADDYALNQEYAGYITQLRGLLDETTGQPPAGVHTAEVERRVALIQSALDEVERRSAETRWRIELRQNQRFLDTYERRIKAEEEAEQQRAEAEKQRRAQVQETRESQVAYYRSRNERTDAKAQQCRTHNEKVQEDTVLRAGSTEERRTRNLEHLMAERTRKQREMHDREHAKQAYARQVRERRAAKTARDVEEKARQSEIHRQAMEAKLEEIRESKRSAWTAKKAASRAKSIVVWENGEAILETVRNDHSRLMDELDQRQKQQAERYAENKAEQRAYLQQRAQFRASRQERQQETLRKLVEKRVSRGEEIKKEAEEKMEKAAKAKERQATQYQESGKQLDEEIVRHKQRVQQLGEQQHNESLQQNYKRWNHRAARIMEELQEALTDESASAPAHSAADQQSWAAANRRGAPEADHYNDGGQGYGAPAIPSPREFAV